MVSQSRVRAEAVYYGVQNWERSWPVVVDIDAKDIALERAHDTRDQLDGESRDQFLRTLGIYGAPPAGKPYTYDDLREALTYGFAVEDIFQMAFNAESTLVVYSGQGCHVYLLDDDREHRYDKESRQVIVEFLEHSYGLPIDPVVTPDRSRVIRLPYSLHAGVSRIVTPIEDPDFDFREDAQPAFLTESDDQ